MKVLVFGRRGQLGSALANISPKRYNTKFLTKSDIDLVDFSGLRDVVLSAKPAIVINAAAYTAVDRAESEADIAFKINAEAPGIMASACEEIGAVFMHFSTDYVFDGDARSPYGESAPTNPLGIYGRSKLAGEKAIGMATERYVILRTAWLFSSVSPNFLKTMLWLAEREKEIRVVSDQIGSPTYAYDLAAAAWMIADSLRESDNNNFGLYHAVNSGVTSWHKFATAIFELVGRTDIVVHPISTEEYPTSAPRPRFTALSCRLMHKNFGIALPDWRDAASRCLKQLRYENQRDFSPS